MFCLQTCLLNLLNTYNQLAVSLHVVINSIVYSHVAVINWFTWSVGMQKITEMWLEVFVCHKREAIWSIFEIA